MIYHYYTNNVFTDLYADDTTLYYNHKSEKCIEKQLQIALQALTEWCKVNGMLINTSKTKVMLTTTHQRHSHLNEDILQLTYKGDANYHSSKTFTFK